MLSSSLILTYLILVTTEVGINHYPHCMGEKAVVQIH